MKFNRRAGFAIAISMAINIAQAQEPQQHSDTLGDKLKKLFVRPTATPKPRKKRISTATATPSPTPASSQADENDSSPVSPGESPSLPIEAQRTEPQGAQPQYFEPVRPISPGPRSRRRATPRMTATPEMSAIASATAAPSETTSASPTPSPILTPLPTETPFSRPTPSLPPLIKVSPTAVEKKPPTATRVISLGDIADSENYSPELKKILDVGLNLSARNLPYKYVAADPASGGMDSSGFVYYVLTHSGIANAPRDARDQYIWVRKAGTFQAVLAQRDDSFELDGLKPGDLLFWASNYGLSADPDIVQTMIYLGRDKTSKQRLMVGASEAGSFRDKPRSGVGVFDFKIGRAAPNSNKEPGPVFVGYGHIPTVSSQ